MTIVETWEREDKPISSLLQGTNYQCVSQFRIRKGRKNNGGGVSILYNEKHFFVKKLEFINVPNGVEVVWALLCPKNPSKKPKRICFAAIYISPKSRFKTDTITHIIETIHLVRSKFNNDVCFALSGDFNKTPVRDILDSYGALQQVVTKPTRKNNILELILTDLHTYYFSPQSLPPLEVDIDKEVMAVTMTSSYFHQF